MFKFKNVFQLIALNSLVDNCILKLKHRYFMKEPRLITMEEATNDRQYNIFLLFFQPIYSNNATYKHWHNIQYFWQDKSFSRKNKVSVKSQ